MEFLISANTDIGIVKKTNQDSLSVKIINTSNGKMSFAVLCDGMGGLAKGEVASASLVCAFDKWLKEQFPTILDNLNEKTIREQWEYIITYYNNTIKNYGLGLGVSLGTTAVIILITDEFYYVMNIGDSRAYEISDKLVQITKDQTYIVREIEEGRMTPEQARIDPRRNVLLQCVGASEVVVPDMFVGKTKKGAVYMLCSDGFRHEVTPDEIFQYLNPNVLTSINNMNNNALALIELNKTRNERDNISIAMIRTY